jgi:hypothetical protein
LPIGRDFASFLCKYSSNAGILPVFGPDLCKNSSNAWILHENVHIT